MFSESIPKKLIPLFFIIFEYINTAGMQHDIPLEEMVRKGAMVKSPFKMTLEELKVWHQENKDEARKYLFSIGQPLVYEKNGRMVAEFADGRIKELH